MINLPLVHDGAFAEKVKAEADASLKEVKRARARVIAFAKKRLG